MNNFKYFLASLFTSLLICPPDTAHAQSIRFDLRGKPGSSFVTITGSGVVLSETLFGSGGTSFQLPNRNTGFWLLAGESIGDTFEPTWSQSIATGLESPLTGTLRVDTSVNNAPFSGSVFSSILFDVEGGVGDDILLTSGFVSYPGPTFSARVTVSGTSTFMLGEGNTIDDLIEGFHGDPTFGSGVLVYTVTLVGDGDANGDGVFDNLDIAPFVLALTNLPAYQAMYPNVDPDVALDMNFDGGFDNLDIADFVAALTGGTK